MKLEDIVASACVSPAGMMIVSSAYAAMKISSESGILEVHNVLKLLPIDYCS